ncbi:ABC-three component system middle component 2 [Rhizobium ruizarguesonis]|uniref:ABC-three component system middle component 2 n=1 Tax=Rhizobium ruizarguesonis TaxID=2081791 RepID=UPI0013E0168C|nr:ABC-three component system middle component 2 [Rhizobium ruizarguesonis]NEJ98641.1 threonine efflux protein [Rhizobium ruizarguesonis]QND22746.1 threonine efflux protein [Rhizobium leguminosarum bv. viciae]
MTESPALFNTPLEAGLRTVIILDAFAPEAFDIGELSLLDYYVVHASDAGAKESVHPDLEARAGEYFVRRKLIQDGLSLMVGSFLIDEVHCDRGIFYRSREMTSALVDLMSSHYNNRLKESCGWLVKKSKEEGLESFFLGLRSGIVRWTHEVIGEHSR